MKKSLVFFLIMIILSLTGCGASINESDIVLEPVKWTSTESIFGIEYDEFNFGVLVTNKGESTVQVDIKADYYNKEGHWLDETEQNRALALGAGQTMFVPISVYEDDTDYVEYSLKSLQSSNYKTLTAGLDKSNDIYFEFNFEEKEVVVTNNSEFETWGCGIQFFFYNEDGNIINVETISGGKIPAGKTVSGDCYIGNYIQSGEYDYYETVGLAYYHK